MAFNVGKFVKSASKSAVGSALDDIVGAATSKLPMGLISSAQSTVDSLFNVGASFESISAFATRKTDSIVNQNADVYFALAGKDPVKTAAADIARLRRANTDDVKKHLSSINPTTAINAKKREAAAIIDAVI